MKETIIGRAHLFGKNISTDQIYPGQYLELVEPKEIATHCLEGADPDFTKAVEPGDIVVAGSNFGCGSSREHAVITLVESGVACVVAESFARIFYRNAINLALPLIVCGDVLSFVESGEQLRIDLTAGMIEKVVTGASLQGESLSDYAMTILQKGGIKDIFREKTRKMYG